VEGDGPTLEIYGYFIIPNIELAEVPDLMMDLILYSFRPNIPMF